MKNKKIITLSSLLLILLSSCAVNPIFSPDNTIDVNGQLISTVNTPIEAALVSIAGSSVTTSSDGRFTINNVAAPYTVKIIDNTNYNCIVFENLSNPNPVLVGVDLNSNDQATEITVTHPQLTGGAEANMFFVDDAGIYYGSSYEHHYGGSSLVLLMPPGMTIHGKVVYLQFVYVSGEIDYTNYGEKQITITSGINQNITFLQSDISFDPAEGNVSGTINGPPSNSNPGYIGLVLNFSSFENFGYYNSIAISDFSGTASFNYKIPIGLPMPFQIYIAAGTDNAAGDYGLRRQLVQNGSSGNSIATPGSISYINPPSSGVNYNTVFSFSDSPDPGVFEIRFYGGGKDWVIFTTSASVRIPDFRPLLDIGSNQHIELSVKKHYDFSSIDVFVSSNFKFNNVFTGQAKPYNQWRFTTE